ncbi:MAG: transketolase C-terminal domain-containing protein [Bacteroidales bacterium]|jgi:transketolase|nr:transketolase family protein [Bacteroidales bacterium]MDD2204116.1 transketolase C-terminal domain-containing protein [Bacteroidales bacterium]MDD3913780.1 transketolase C-terminal domain-containing protein [Bacteroidales bacterium]MDD4633545.1 transketolase C-terminal domain-containing protein [Bacteroidales bacterium]
MKDFPILDKKDTRSGFGKGLYEAALKNPNIVALCADLTGSVKMDEFAKAFPDRFYQMGIAEANMIGVAAGLATAGKIPFTGTFANFSTARVFDQIRQAVAYSNKNVKICASHAGITLGEDGATHQTLEDIGMMKMLPGMTVVVPCDYEQTRLATLAVAEYEGPVYLRFGRPKQVVFTTAAQDFVIGKAQLLDVGRDISIFATGIMVWEAIQACKKLEEMGIDAEIINIHTIKPLDNHAILNSVKKTGCVVTAEEHQINGGLCDSISQLLCREYPVPVEAVAIFDQWGQSGTPDELMKLYNLTSDAIVNAAVKAIQRK